MKRVSLFFLCLLLISLAYYGIRRLTTVPYVRFEPITLNLPEEPTLHFFALGDTGSGDKNQFAVAAAMEKRCQELGKIDGLLFLGDHFYMKGVSSIEDPQWQEKLEKPYGTPCLSQATIYPVLGNHEYEGNPNAFIAYTEHHKRWHMPHRFYSLKYGRLLKIVAFDSNFPDFCFLPHQCAIDFLLSELDHSTQWQIVIAHHPLRGSAEHGPNYTGRTFPAWLLRQLTCERSDAWISGHSHHMEHGKLPGCRENYLISGGGGGDLYPVDKGVSGSLFHASQYGFLEITVSKAAMTFQFRDTNNQVLYTSKEGS